MIFLRDQWPPHSFSFCPLGTQTTPTTSSEKFKAIVIFKMREFYELQSKNNHFQLAQNSFNAAYIFCAVLYSRDLNWHMHLVYTMNAVDWHEKKTVPDLVFKWAEKRLSDIKFEQHRIACIACNWLNKKSIGMTENDGKKINE